MKREQKVRFILSASKELDDPPLTRDDLKGKDEFEIETTRTLYHEALMARAGL